MPYIRSAPEIQTAEFENCRSDFPAVLTVVLRTVLAGFFVKRYSLFDADAKAWSIMRLFLMRALRIDRFHWTFLAQKTNFCVVIM